jgi:hypothetical protein
MAVRDLRLSLTQHLVGLPPLLPLNHPSTSTTMLSLRSAFALFTAFLVSVLYLSQSAEAVKGPKITHSSSSFAQLSSRAPSRSWAFSR